MTALQQSWIRKIKSWVPAWFYIGQDVEINIAYIEALARVLELAETDIETDHAMTFVLKAIGGFLDLKGGELGISRVTGEYDNSYRTRLRITPTKSNIDIISLKELVDTLLIKGESTLIEDFENDLFLNSNVFCNRGNLLLDKIENTFTVVVDKQVADPVTFLNQNVFCDSENFIEQADSQIEFFNIIVQLINENKAGGTFYRLIERSA